MCVCVFGTRLTHSVCMNRYFVSGLHWRISFADQTIEDCLGTFCVSPRPVLISDFFFFCPKAVSGVFQLAEHYCPLMAVI